jgi:hypothetical protein
MHTGNIPVVGIGPANYKGSSVEGPDNGASRLIGCASERFFPQLIRGLRMYKKRYKQNEYGKQFHEGQKQGSGACIS